MRIRFSPLIATASGKAADAVASSWKGRAYIRKLVTPANPQSAAQVLVRDSLARCVTLWRSLHASTKSWLNTYGTSYRMSGYNIFMKKNRALEQAGSVLLPVPAHPNVIVPGSLTFATGAGGSGTVLITWTDDVIANYSDLWVWARESSLNALGVSNTVAANLDTMTLSGLTAGVNYDLYAAYFNSADLKYGTSGGELDVTSVA